MPLEFDAADLARTSQTLGIAMPVPGGVGWNRPTGDAYLSQREKYTKTDFL